MEEQYTTKDGGENNSVSKKEEVYKEEKEE